MSIPWSENAAVRRWIFLGYWLLMFAATHVPHIDRFGPESWRDIPHLDKVVHFGLFAGWVTLAGWLACPGSARPSSRVIVGLFAAGALYGAFDELTQSLVGRETSLADYLADLAGMATVIMIRLRWARRGQRRKA